MKAFLGWSGKTSRLIAKQLWDWIPKVNPHIRVFVSFEDIEAGTLWSVELTNMLKETSYGVLCVTSDNVKAPWLFYETGVLSMSTSLSNPDNRPRVAPILFGMARASDLPSPLSHYQSKIFGKDEMWNLIRFMNDMCKKLYREQLSRTAINEEPPKTYLEQDKLKGNFDALYPELEKAVEEILRDNPPPDNSQPDAPFPASPPPSLPQNAQSANPNPPQNAKPENVDLLARKLEEIHKALGVFPEIQNIYHEGGELLIQFDPFQMQDVRQVERGQDLLRFRKMLLAAIDDLTNSIEPKAQRRDRIRAIQELLDIVDKL